MGRIDDLRKKAGHLRDRADAWTNELTVFEAMGHDPVEPPDGEMDGTSPTYVWWAERAIASAIAWAERAEDWWRPEVRLPMTVAPRFYWWAEELGARKAARAKVSPVALVSRSAVEAWTAGSYYGHNAPEGPVAEFVERMLESDWERRSLRVDPLRDEDVEKLVHDFDVSELRRSLREQAHWRYSDD